MRQSGVLALLRGVVALLVLAAIAVQIIDNVGQGTFNPTRFFAYFTILSNLFGAILFLVLAARYREPRSDTLDLLRGANVVYLTVTFIVVIWLLSGADLQVAIPWVDFVLHKLFPVLAVIDWLIDPPINWITPRRALVWLAYPLVWVTATLIRGAVDGWYPYPFLDPANGGYGSVAFYVTTILVGFLGISAITLWLGNAVRER